MNQTNQVFEPSTNDSPRAERLWAGCFYVISAVGLALLLSNRFGSTAALWIGLALSAVSIAAQTRLAHSFAAAFGHALILILLAVAVGSPLLAGILGAVISACCAFDVLCRKDSAAYLPALPLLAYALSALLLRSPLTAALSLTVLPPACVLVFCLRKHTERISAICRLAVAILATALPAMAFFLYRRLGSLSFDTLRSFLNETRIGAVAAATEMIALSGDSFGISVDAASYAEAAVGQIFNVLPALIVILALLVAYGIHSAALRCLIGRKESKETINKMLSFDMSLISALLFFFALLLSLLFIGEKTAFYGAVAQNLYLILVPGMLMTAFIALNTLLFAKAPSCFSPILYFAILFLSIQFPTIMLPLAACFGAGVVILGRIRLRLHKNNS